MVPTPCPSLAHTTIWCVPDYPKECQVQIYRIRPVARLVQKITQSRVTNSKCMLTPTNLLLVMCSHRGMHANPGIGGGGVVQCVYISRGSGGMLQKSFENFVP